MFLNACENTCIQEYTYLSFEPVYMGFDEFRSQDPSFEVARPLQNTGKVYLKYPYVFVNEINEGLHIIDDRFDPVHRFIYPGQLS